MIEALHPEVLERFAQQWNNRLVCSLSEPFIQDVRRVRPALQSPRVVEYVALVTHYAPHVAQRRIDRFGGLIGGKQGSEVTLFYGQDAAHHILWALGQPYGGYGDKGKGYVNTYLAPLPEPLKDICFLYLKDLRNPNAANRLKACLSNPWMLIWGKSVEEVKQTLGANNPLLEIFALETHEDLMNNLRWLPNMYRLAAIQT